MLRYGDETVAGMEGSIEGGRVTSLDGWWTPLLVGMLGLGGFWVAGHGLRQPAGLPRGLAAATLAWAWATLGLEVLGPLGWLHRVALLLWSAAGLLIGLACRGLRPAGPAEEPPSAPRGGGWEGTLAVGLV